MAISDHSSFESWRRTKSPERSWGLAWFLANEVCQRFYASHGIVPWVIDHEGLGYYGFSLNRLPCHVHGRAREPFGRLTICGDVENWVTGSPGDHGASIAAMCAEGAPADALVTQAVHHLDLPVLPVSSHLSCRHKRWGASYELCFAIATILALRNEPETLQIWNHPLHTEQRIRHQDPKCDMAEHPGAFVFIRDGTECLLIGDGRLFGATEVDLWVRFMRGESATALAAVVEEALCAS